MAIDLNGSTGISLDDNEKINIGNDSDLQIYHDGTHSYVADAGGGSLVLSTNGSTVSINTDGPENMAIFRKDSSVDLFYNNSKKFETTSTGIDVTGNATFADNGKAIFGAGSDLQIYHTGSESFIDEAGTGGLYIRANDRVEIHKYTGEVMIGAVADGEVTLYHDNAIKLATTSTGINVTGAASTDGIKITNPLSGSFYNAKLEFTRDGTSGGAKIQSERNSAGGVGMSFNYTANNTAEVNATYTKAMTIDASGKVGIGDSSPSARLQVGGMAAGEQALLIQSPRNDALSNGLARINITDSNCPFAGLQIDHAGTGPALIANGQALINTATDDAGSGARLHITGNSSQSACSIRIGTNSYPAWYFVNASGTKVGDIVIHASSTSYNTSSDYRLKENVVDLTGASARVNQLNPSRFNFIADDTNTLVDGFLAHEVATVVPEAITGTKDAMKDEEYEVTPAVEATYDEDGNELTAAVEAVMGTRSVPDYQGIDQSKLVPLLTAALQEALTEIASLKTRVEALEA